MAEDAHDTNTWAAHDNTIDSQIKSAMRSRIPYFRKEADALTFEGVRRLLEKDLELEKFALDVHKRFIKECLEKFLDGADDDNASKNSVETGETNVCSTIEEIAESREGRQSKKHVKEPCSEDEEKMEDSPVLGLLTGHKTNKSETKETQSVKNKEVPSESTIKKAIRQRASYLKANSDKVTMAILRRLLEEDLKLEKHALDPYKKFISEQLDEAIASVEVSEPATGIKKKNLKKNSPSKASKKVNSEESSEPSDNESDEEEEVKPKKKIISKGKMQDSEGLKKRKRPEKDTKVSSKKNIKSVETKSEDNGDAEGSGVDSADGHSQSSAEKPVKKKEVSTPTYGKRVEHLKSVIKACGMSVPPSIYKKVKQAPENKREAHLIKELEEILSREGLSSNPTEKEIKEVKKRKERAKELEGIDMSNIVSSSRRRSTTSFVAPPAPPKPKTPDESGAPPKPKTPDESGAPPKPKTPDESGAPPKPNTPDESGGDDTEDTDNDDDNDDNDDDDEDNDADGGDDDDSQSEEFNEDNDEDSD